MMTNTYEYGPHLLTRVQEKSRLCLSVWSYECMCSPNSCCFPCFRDFNKYMICFNYIIYLIISSKKILLPNSARISVMNIFVYELEQWPFFMQIDNIKACLTCLGELGVSVDGVQAQDVRQGNLKAILGLFFSLSRHKQQQKHLTRQSEAMPRYEAMSLEGSATYLLTEQHNSWTIHYMYLENMFSLR